MKIYFTASLRQRKTHGKVHRKIMDYLQHQGHIVFEKILSPHLVENNQQITARYIKEWYQEWNSYVTDCDVAVIEGSHPSSIHIGFEIAMILARGKPVVLLYREGQNPVFINDLYATKLIKSEYSEENLEDILDWCFRELEHITNRRFAFFVSPEIDDFLTKVSQDKDISRSEYIRMLIEREMTKRH